MPMLCALSYSQPTPFQNRWRALEVVGIVLVDTSPAAKGLIDENQRCRRLAPREPKTFIR
jgi:hypothetical protein